MASQLSVAIVGTGQIGASLALAFSIDGYPACLISRTEEGAERALGRVSELTGMLTQHAVLEPEAAEQTLARISATADLASGVRGAAVVFEAIPEKLGLKRELIQRLEELTGPSIILASGTSGLPITQLASEASFPERVIGTHFWNPPHLMRLVEVTRGDRTAAEVVERICELIRSLGKEPVVIRDIPGGIGNRLQYAMMQEAISLIDRGVASPADVDTVVKLGFGSRLAAIGPLETSDLIGLNLVQAIAEYLLADLDRSVSPPDVLREKIHAGELGIATGKGFYDWDAAAARELRERMTRELIGRYRSWRKPRPEN